MKKLFMMLASASMMCMVACSGDKSQTSATEESPATEPVVETLSPAEANSKAGKEFIAGLVKADSTVTVTPSGLAYK
ncbi:MAG: FKBP-type peptidyl-prolyl cis-trans isomerase N-terminal domain-containing protein, partial [Muribaculaceae bacterium]|nr:FKBP-type peptidyl-prolyl cis-trans isomerase N-terminal domain-containing protein [Muribaculaceae bacterium]